MKPIQELFSDLLERGYSYRYDPERFAELASGGHPYPSPTRTVNTPSGQMIEEMIQPALEPIILDMVRVQQLKEIARAWPVFLQGQYEIFKLAQRGRLDAQSIAAVRATCTEREWECGLVNPGYRTLHPFVRLDAVLADGEFKVIDINSTRPAGVGDIVCYQQSLNGTGGQGIRQFPLGASFTQIVRACVDEWAEAKHLPGESIPIDVVVRQTDGDWSNFQHLGCLLKRAGMSVRFIEPTDLSLSQPSAILRSRIKEGDPSYAVLEQGYPNQRCVISPLYRRFLGNKRWMYLYRVEPFKQHFQKALGQDYDVLDRAFAEIGLVSNGFVRLPDEDRSLVFLDQNDWVLKDPASSSGRRMFLGYLMGKRKWQQSLSTVRDGWIAQRFHYAREELSVVGAAGEAVSEKFYMKYGIFIFGNELGGLECMARPVPVVHGARNTYMTGVSYRD